MPDQHTQDEPMLYQIRIEGHLNQDWSDWFDNVSVELEDNGETVFIGKVIDQPALYGLLRKIRDLGMPLISVNRLKQNEGDES